MLKKCFALSLVLAGTSAALVTLAAQPRPSAAAKDVTVLGFKLHGGPQGRHHP